MRESVLLAVFWTLFSCVTCTLTPFITPCYSSDTECLKQSTQRALPVIAAGVTSLGMQSLDPMTLELVSASQSGLEMEFKNTVVKGLRNCEVMHVKRYTQRTRLDLKCSVTLIGDYTLGGYLLIMPIEGHGRYKIKIRDIVVKIDLKFTEREANGQRYWLLDSYRHAADVRTRVQFQFQNLFGGNRLLSDNIHEYANNNWREIFKEMSPPIVSDIVSKISDEIRKLFDAVPISDMSLD
ncbi:unnamed protein product [Parnassius apollo]|uniref:(apollo) hypothetical protein n=1 Tax=Parnassius apollo TaxID=110799 RepID=A0A8S3Y8P5_PARAO|nr:unnamed protein product [Parnassius apollo]